MEDAKNLADGETIVIKFPNEYRRLDIRHLNLEKLIREQKDKVVQISDAKSHEDGRYYCAIVRPSENGCYFAALLHNGVFQEEKFFYENMAGIQISGEGVAFSKEFKIERYRG